jgi:hypothetical protein
MEDKIQIDIEENKKIQKNWDKMQEWYENEIERYTISGTVTCAI